jgi:hypothetical protein
MLTVIAFLLAMILVVLSPFFARLVAIIAVATIIFVAVIMAQRPEPI